jgi:hypothetical protein
MPFGSRPLLLTVPLAPAPALFCRSNFTPLPAALVHTPTTAPDPRKAECVRYRKVTADLEESVIDAITAIASITGVKQDLIYADTNRSCALEQVPRKMLRQAPKKRAFASIIQCLFWTSHWFAAIWFGHQRPRPLARRQPTYYFCALA